MVKPGNRRIEKYRRKLESMRVAYETFTKSNPDISIYGDLADVQATIAGILNRHGILKRDRAKYQSFGLQVWHYAREGQLSEALLNWLIEGYKLEGAREDILKEIAQAIIKPGAARAAAPTITL